MKNHQKMKITFTIHIRIEYNLLHYTLKCVRVTLKGRKIRNKYLLNSKIRPFLQSFSARENRKIIFISQPKKPFFLKHRMNPQYFWCHFDAYIDS
eukprot:TRINITY_DN119_c0_g2_i1.p1 TRINITY_DN119_c0_g2~~TRINITY_DN119_c0_g2_i1.p1  ORF type:complete len:95 (+),score=6.54 TRINITY_DN119_c0_g2_i1:176-460(+)